MGHKSAWVDVEMHLARPPYGYGSHGLDFVAENDVGGPDRMGRGEEDIALRPAQGTGGEWLECSHDHAPLRGARVRRRSGIKQLAELPQEGRVVEEIRVGVYDGDKGAGRQQVRAAQVLGGGQGSFDVDGVEAENGLAH